MRLARTTSSSLREGEKGDRKYWTLSVLACQEPQPWNLYTVHPPNVHCVRPLSAISSSVQREGRAPSVPPEDDEREGVVRTSEPFTKIKGQSQKTQAPRGGGHPSFYLTS